MGLPWWFRVAVVLSLAACVPPRAPRRDAGVDASDGGVPVIFSIGIGDNANVSHQVAPYINLMFETGSPSTDTVLSRRVLVPPVVDGLDSDWANIAGSQIPLQPAGASIGMRVEEWNAGYGLLTDGGLKPWDFGIDHVFVKSAFDDTNIYFMIQWADATANISKNTLTFTSAGWVRSTEDEDHLYLSFDVTFPDHAELGCVAACHLRERLDDTSDAGIYFRTRMHTNGPGEVSDVWHWGSVATNPISHADDLSFGQTTRVNDTGTGFSGNNRVTVDGGLQPSSMSEFGVNSNPSAIYAPDSGLHPAAVPFNPDGGIAIGTRIPGLVYQQPSGSRADVHAVGQWRNGKWTVELMRARVTSDPNDTQF